MMASSMESLRAEGMAVDSVYRGGSAKGMGGDFFIFRKSVCGGYYWAKSGKGG